MTDKFYEITKTAVNLLLKIYDSDPAIIAFILTAQAEGDAENLIKELEAVIEFCDKKIALLQDWKNNHKNEEYETERSI